VVHDLDNALLLLNGWLGRPVQLLVLIRNGAPPGELPPSQPSPRWHAVLGGKARVGRPKLAEATDLERQLTVETYELGDGPLKLLFGDLPYQRVLALGKDDQPDRLAFYSRGRRWCPVAWRGIEPEGSRVSLQRAWLPTPSGSIMAPQARAVVWCLATGSRTAGGLVGAR
jgi:hypothetical protein